MPADRFRLYSDAELAPVIDDMARQAAPAGSNRPGSPAGLS